MVKKLFSKKDKADKQFLSFSTVLFTVVGLVIGVGIFLRNDGLMSTTGSAWASLIAWVSIGTLAFLLALAFVEIGSSTKEKGGNISKWASMFYSPFMGRMVSVFLVYLIMPIFSVALAVIATNFLFRSFGIFGEFNTIGDGLIQSRLRLWTTVGVSGALFIIFYLANVMSKKPGEAYVRAASILKFLPLIFVFLMGTIYAIGASFFASDAIIKIGDGRYPVSINDAVKNQGAIIKESGGFFIVIMMATPAVMFTMDGFIHSANLQGRMKSSKSYIKALIMGMILILGTYLLVSVPSYASGSARLYIPNTTAGWSEFWKDYASSSAFRDLADGLAVEMGLADAVNQSDFQTAILTNGTEGWQAAGGYGYGVVGVVKSIFGNVLPLISVLLLLIFISASGISNVYWFTGPKAAELGSRDRFISFDIEDKTGTGNHRKAGEFFGKVALFWFILIWGIEITFFYTNTLTDKAGMTDFFDASADALTVIIFFIYAVVVSGGVVNRIRMSKGKKHVKVDKKGFFLWVAIPAIIATFVMPIIAIYGHITNGNIVAPLILIYAGVWFLLTGINELLIRSKARKMPQSAPKAKVKAKKA